MLASPAAVRNRNPIFIVGLSRSGSSILLNILRSHPDVCSPRGETHQVFYGKPDEPLSTRLFKALRYLPIVLRQREHVFSLHNYRERRPLLPGSMALIDRVLFFEKLRATGVTQNRYRAEGVEYTVEQIRRSRLLCKNLDGLVFTTPLFAGMYPDATFFGLVRNGLAVCEGHVRRGRSAAAIGRRYARACGQILADARCLPNFHLVRYETLTRETLVTAGEIFELARLDGSQVRAFRLVVGHGGDEARTGGSADQLRWYTPGEFEETIASGVDDEQIRHIARRDRDDFLAEAGSVMEELGYL